MSHGRTNAVVACIAAANDNNVLALRADVVAVLEVRVQERLCILLKEFHGKVNAIDISVRDLEVARPGRACSEYYGVKLGLKVLDVKVHPNVDIGHEGLQE